VKIAFVIVQAPFLLLGLIAAFIVRGYEVGNELLDDWIRSL
jgi:hypothetical protein